ncbi:hypothetical protein PS6_009466 [Mucor atramentarius]
MPPKRNLTPKQLSNSLSYVQKEAPFLARLKNQNQEKEKAARKFENYEDGQDDDDYNELDGAQVVELDAKGRAIAEIFKKQDEDEEKEEKEEESKEPEAPAVDENGRLLFRKQTTSTKRKLQSIIDEEIKKSDKPSLKNKKKKTKSKPTSSLLSFEQDDE